MSIKDFYISDDYLKRYETKERFWFENEFISFWYRFIIGCHEYSTWGGDWYTSYTLYLFPDDESIHESRKDNLTFMKIDLNAYAFRLRERRIKGKIDEKVLDNIANSIDKINVESKIKVRKYEKIKGLVNGTIFSIG